MVVAVIGLRWHLPTDALAGVVLGVGVVLLVDGLLHLRSSRVAPAREVRSPEESDRRPHLASRR
jgi:membrane-associated phospholipid phosphatase